MFHELTRFFPVEILDVLKNGFKEMISIISKTSFLAKCSNISNFFCESKKFSSSSFKGNFWFQ